MLCQIGVDVTFSNQIELQKKKIEKNIYLIYDVKHDLILLD